MELVELKYTTILQKGQFPLRPEGGHNEISQAKDLVSGWMRYILYQTFNISHSPRADRDFSLGLSFSFIVVLNRLYYYL